MTDAERLALLPHDCHIRYRQMQIRGRVVWVARWRDTWGIRRSLQFDGPLPIGCPDHPCQHRGTLYPWRVPTTPEEQQEAIERGRRANALRKVRSNQYRKQRELAAQNIA